MGEGREEWEREGRNGREEGGVRYEINST
jgi:hypothetical protein